LILELIATLIVVSWLSSGLVITGHNADESQDIMLNALISNTMGTLGTEVWSANITFDDGTRRYDRVLIG